MSESEAAAVQGGDREDDCPLCLEPLPPFWDRTGKTVTLYCCGKDVCRACYDERTAFVKRAYENGSLLGMGEEERRQVEQLRRFCPLCRTELGTPRGKIMKDKFEEGRLPLHLYRDLAVLYRKGAQGLEVDVERGMEILMLGAQKGDPNCQYLLGGLYRDGEYGAPKSLEDAKRWYSAATEQGHAVAECNLAMMSRDEGNDAEYLRYLRGSASKGCDLACYGLGLAYCNGFNGLQPSTNEAIRVAKPAAERGNADCMWLLGHAMCCSHDGTLDLPTSNPNFTKGMHWIRRAAEVGNQTAISDLKSLEEVVCGICFKCNKEAPPEKAFLRCARCRAAWYCSKDCQVQHWKAKEGGHKQCCIKWG